MGRKNDAAYEEELEALQVGLVRTHVWALEKGMKLVGVFEGRDAAGKDGTIKRITEYLSVRSTRVVALPKPSDRERTQWWFQRYSDHLPSEGEWVLYNRSWYNRAGVERVMGFCSPEQTEQFLRDAPIYERMLIESGIRLGKYWLDISRKEQAKRIEERREDPLKLLKISPLDAVAVEKFDDYTAARDEMLTRTHTTYAPWFCVRADDKKSARLNIIRHALKAIGCPGLSKDLQPPDPDVVFPFEASALTDGRLAR
ncbi:polyphosphate kinase 2 [Caulobacter sp. 17J80-11]|uniref:polyphosphate kinase 2 n=1 Tax=Caulobacter sp. 17J80-11 TaxID=2763502 RepID=UPI001653593E|nr:polyphosphate kinase 2 [Caulobacter sp. 17J80-11]MBC6982222.1 polyphosphate kinase 2 [Caulobacter sp. 17J80-11]